MGSSPWVLGPSGSQWIPVGSDLGDLGHMAMDQYLYIAFLVGWTSINPSYFDVNRRGYQGFDTLPYWTYWNIGNISGMILIHELVNPIKQPVWMGLHTIPSYLDTEKQYSLEVGTSLVPRVFPRLCLGFFLACASDVVPNGFYVCGFYVPRIVAFQVRGCESSLTLWLPCVASKCGF